MSDVGLDVVEYVYKRMKIDVEWSLRTDRGFIWWGGPLAQHIWAEPCIDSGGTVVSRIHCRTDVVENFDGTEDQLERLRPISRLASVSGFIRDPEEPTRLQLASSLYVHAGVQNWIQELLAWVAPMQAKEARDVSLILEGQDEDAPVSAVSEHPRSGLRPELDDMLFLTENIIIPIGEQPNRWESEEMIRLSDFLQRPPCILATGSTTGMTAEFPFPPDQGWYFTCLLQVEMNEPHPYLGCGCLIRLTLPFGDKSAEMMEVALQLNERELTSPTENQFLGSWCPDAIGLTFVSFLPNALYCPSAATNLALSCAGRARWITEGEFGFDWDENFEACFQRKLQQLGYSKGREH